MEHFPSKMLKQSFLVPRSSLITIDISIAATSSARSSFAATPSPSEPSNSPTPGEIHQGSSRSSSPSSSDRGRSRSRSGSPVRKRRTLPSRTLPSRDEKWFERIDGLDMKDDNVPLWSKIWHFGLDLMKPSHVGAGHDYSSAIKHLINVETLNAPREKGVLYSCTWQIYDKNGKTYREKDLNTFIRNDHMKKMEGSPNLSYCISKLCDPSRCAHHEGKEPGSIRSITTQIAKLVATWYCVNCSSAYSSKWAIGDHGRYCEYQGRAAAEDPNTANQQTKKKFRYLPVTIEKITTTENFEEKLDAFLEKIHDQMQASDSYPKEKNFNEFLEELKQDPDYEFIDVFNKFHYSPEKFRVTMDDDTFHQIIYRPKNKHHIIKNKSPRFQMVEIAAEKSISIHRLDVIRDEALTAEDKKCHYDGCACEGKFSNDDSDLLVGHVLENNILIVCVGCNNGFRNMNDYDTHLRPKCWLPRPLARKQS